MSSEHPMGSGFPLSSYFNETHLPALIRPYFADVISTSSFGWHCALNVSQLQYSLWRSKLKIPDYIFCASHFMLLSCLVVALRKASSRSHSSIVCRCDQDDLSSVALGTECFPITILSRKIWMKNTLLYLPHILKRVGFLGHRMSFGHIFQVSFVHSWRMSSVQPRLARTVHWMSPSCNTLYADLNKRYLIISSAHPNWCRFPWLSNVSCTHLPILILP